MPLDDDPPGSGLPSTYATTLGIPLVGNALVLLATPSADATSFTLHDVAGEVQLATSATNGAISFTATGSNRPLVVRFRQEAAPTSVMVNGAATPSIAMEALASTPGWWHDPANPYTYVRLAPAASQTLSL